jgi:hypothetical protein
LIVGASLIQALPLVETDATFTESVALTEDGTPVVMRQQEDTGEVEYLDLQGNPVPPPIETQWLRQAYLPLRWARVALEGMPRLSDGGAPATYWYMQEDPSPGTARGYLVGYDSKSKRLIGYLGLGGFYETVPAPEQMFPGIRSEPDEGFVYFSAQLPGAMQVPSFAPPGATLLDEHTKVFIPTADAKILAVNLQKRTTAPVYEGAPPLGAAVFRSAVEPRALGRLAVRTADALLLLESSGEIRERIPIPDALQRENFGVAITKNKDALFDWTGPQDSLSSTRLIRLFRVRADGQITEDSISLATVPTSRRTQAYGGYVYPSTLLVAFVVCTERVPGLIYEGLEHSKAAARWRALREFRVAILTAAAISLVFAVFCWRRTTRYRAGVGERVVWALFVLLFGLPGWIGFRYGRVWPVLEACSACEKETPGNCDVCRHCGEELLAPVETGTEVFA